MKNITITISDETYRKARVWAAVNNTTISGLVRNHLESLPAPETVVRDLSVCGLVGPGTPLPPYVTVKL
jgi:hypothetical protein